MFSGGLHAHGRLSIRQSGAYLCAVSAQPIIRKALLRRMGVTNVVSVPIRTKIENNLSSMKPLLNAIPAITNSMIPRPFSPMPRAQLCGFEYPANRPLTGRWP